MGEMSTEYAARILEVDPSTVVEDELRDRYRTLLKAHHPDLGPTEERTGREVETAKINASFRWLMVHIERREELRRDEETTRLFTDAGWKYEPITPDWWPKEPTPFDTPQQRRSSSRNPRKSKPTLRSPDWPSLGRQRSVILLVGAAALVSGAQWYESLALMITAILLGSALVGRPLGVINDLVNPLESLSKTKR